MFGSSRQRKQRRKQRRQRDRQTAKQVTAALMGYQCGHCGCTADDGCTCRFFQGTVDDNPSCCGCHGEPRGR